MILRVGVLVLLIVVLSEASTFLEGLSGGATRTKDDSSSAFLASPPSVADPEEIIYITKRDGSSEPLDGTKVSKNNDQPLLIRFCFFSFKTYILESERFYIVSRICRPIC